MVSHLYNISFIFLTSLFMVDFIVYIRVIRVIRSLDHPLFSFVIMSLCLQKSLCLRPSLCYSVSKKSSVSICHYVILSSRKSSIPICHYVILSSRKSSISIFHYVILSPKNHLSLSVSMLFCLKKIICLHLSLCHSVFKKINYLHLSLCYSVFKKTFVSICHYVILSSKIPLSSSVPLLFCLKKTSVFICHYVILSQKLPLSLFVPLLLCLPFILSVSC